MLIGAKLVPRFDILMQLVMFCEPCQEISYVEVGG